MKPVTPTIEDAVLLATEKHRGQVDKRGAPYVLHVLAVMAALEPHGTTAMLVGLFHDLFEDTEATPGELLSLGYPEEVVLLSVEMARKEGETYSVYVGRLLPHPVLRKVKRADAEHNLGKTVRLLAEASLSPEERREYERLAAKYRKTLTKIEAAERG